MRRSPRRRHIRSRLPILGLVVACQLLVAGAALALHRETPDVIRVTRTVSHAMSAGRMWGNDMAFVSSADLAFTGNTTQQLFVFRLFPWVCQNGTPEPQSQAQCPNPPDHFILQATANVGNPLNPSLSESTGTCTLLPTRSCNETADCQIGGDFGVCKIDSQWLAFDALGTFGGGTGAQTLRRQILLKNIKTNELRRITAGTDGESTHPSVNSLAGIVTFQSTASLAGPNAGGVSQIFVYEKKTGLLRQITFGQGPSRHAIPNKTGEIIVFESRADLLGGGAETGVWQIYWAEYDKLNHTATLHRLTNGNADSINPFISEVEKKIAFDSLATDLGGVPGGRNVYRADFSTVPPAVAQLTQLATYGNCQQPTLSARGDRIAFICDGDPLQNGTTGNRLFVLEDITNGLKLRQITGKGDVPGPVSHALGLWFLSFATTSDLDGNGSCGTQIYALNYFDQEPGHWGSADEIGELPQDVAGAPPPTGSTGMIGRRNFAVHPGDALAGSTAQLVTRDGPQAATVAGEGFFSLVIGAPDEVTGLSSVKVPAAWTTLPPVSLPGIGTLCFTPTQDGNGFIDCEGANADGSLLVTRDHATDDLDPGCVLGCRESAFGQSSGGPLCPKDWPGPHQVACAHCVGSVCDAGFNAGGACLTDAQCQSTECVNGLMGLCNGLPQVIGSGDTLAGELQLRMPSNMKLSVNFGLDGKVCTADDSYAVTQYPLELRLTTGASTGAITDADNIPGALVSSTTQGIPFNCVSLAAGETIGARLVASLPLLDIPSVPVLRDGVLELRLEPRPEPGVCDAVCTSNIDCDDGNLCNGAEGCVNGVCVAGIPVACDDGDPCNGIESCDPLTGICLPGPPCDDGDACNGIETCDAVNGCVYGTPVVCDDSDACNGLETCDPSTGSCLAGTPPACDDGDFCNGVETCDPASGCLPGTPIDCQDGNACNGSEGCDPATGACLPAPGPLVCDDGNPCTDDACDSATGCFVTNNVDPCDDANACTTGDTCTGGSCLGTPVLCDDGDACNGFESCDPATGLCQPGVPPNCDDNNPCTDDACDSATGCFVTPNTSLCDDGDLCTTGDVCASGACTGTPVICGDGDLCNGVETCDPGTGTCTSTGPLDCDDGNPCTDDACDPVLGCLHTDNTSACDDGNACTTGETCIAGACLGTPVVCDDGDACNGLETCDPAIGCVAAPPLDCNDNDPCTDDGCDSATGCFVTFNTSPCDDGNLCTGGDVCAAGVCSGTPVVCDDGNVCNGSESCDPGTGTCVTTGPLACDDGNACTDDTCDPVLGCLYTNNTGPCDDGDLCTTGDVCAGGACVATPVVCENNDVCDGIATCDPGTGLCIPGTPLVCDDANVCTDDSCNPLLGCVHTNNTLSCDDGNACTLNDACSGGVCTGGSDLLCTVQALETLIQNASTQDLGGNKLARKFLKMAVKARIRAEAAILGNPLKAPKNLLRTRKILEKMIGKVEKAVSRGKMDPDLGESIKDLAQQGIDAVGDLLITP